MENILDPNRLEKISINVSRETCNDLEKYIDLLIKENNDINLISRENENKDYIIERHIIDSMQIIDFIDFNENKIIDLGSGAGFPAIVLSIIAKNKGSRIKTTMYEKSYHKSNFLKKISSELDLNTEVVQKNIFEQTEKNKTIITSRAFKSLPMVLDLTVKNFSNFKNLIIYMGKTGHNVLSETLKKWKIDYVIKKSITNKDSFILDIKNIKKL